MKPKPEVRVLAKQLFGASRVHCREFGPYVWVQQWGELPIENRRMWDAVAREAIKRIGGAK